MNQAPDPQWSEYLELAVAAMVASLARGISWVDPKTGKFSWLQLLQAAATAATIAIGAAAAQRQWNFPVPITAFLAVAGSLVGIPFFVTAFRSVADVGVQMFIRSRSGGGNASQDKPHDAP
jgi:hypothetical protein